MSRQRQEAGRFKIIHWIQVFLLANSDCPGKTNPNIWFGDNIVELTGTDDLYSNLNARWMLLCFKMRVLGVLKHWLRQKIFRKISLAIFSNCTLKRCLQCRQMTCRKGAMEWNEVPCSLRNNPVINHGGHIHLLSLNFLNSKIKSLE